MKLGFRIGHSCDGRNVLYIYETGTEDTYGEGVGRVYESDEDPLDLYSLVEGKIEIKIR